MSAPDLSCLSREFHKSQFGAGIGKVTEHSHLGPRAAKKEKDAVDKMKVPILNHYYYYYISLL